MKRVFTNSGLIALFIAFSIALIAQEKFVFPPNYIPDTRIDNMGYWQKCAAAGLVPVQPMYKPAPAIYTGSKIFLKGVLIQDSPDVPVTTATNSTQSENSIAVYPNDKAKVLNSNNSTPNPSTGSVYGTSTYYTSDEGATWSGTYLGPGGSNSGDPAACVNMSSRWFEGYIDNAYGQSISYSDNQGTSWTIVKVGNGSMLNMLDKNHLWVDNSPTSTFQGYIYDGWMYNSQINVSRSTNNGVAWSTPVSISNATSAGSHNQGENFKTGPDGEVYCVWSVYDSWPGDEKALGFATSMDGGVTWQPATRILNNIRGIRTGGTAKNMRVNSFPSMTVDLSNGPHRGDIYIVWGNHGVPGINTGNDIDCYMIKSSDKGATWSASMKINQDPSGLGKQHYFPWISCDQANGILSVVYYDDRNVSSNQCEVFMSWSIDGGATWQDLKVSDVSFTPSPIPLMASQYMGDYLGITSYSGRTYPCWTDNRLGYCMTYVSPVDIIIPQAKVVYDANILNDTTYGNGNGKMDFGETELLGLTMKNTGNAISDSVTVTLSCQNPYITIIDSTEFYGNFAIGQAITILNGFKYNVSDSLPGLTPVVFYATAKDKYDSMTISTFTIMSHGPALSINLMSVSDPTGNNNGRLDPGETATLYFETENTGDYDAVDVVSHLMTTNPYVTVNSSSFSLGTLTPGQMASASFSVTVSNAARRGSAAAFYNTALSGFQRTSKIFYAKIGLIIEDWETGNFQKFPWAFTGNADWVIDPAIHWEKNYSAHSGAIDVGQTSGLTLNYNALYDDSISFYRKVSSRPHSANNLKFYIDGAMIGQWGGNQNWKYISYPVLAGPHEFKWEYSKGIAAGTDEDKAWVDFIVFPPEYYPSAYAGPDGSTCVGVPYQLNGLAFSYDSLSWTTSGTGTFSNPNIIDPLYTPSSQDATAGSVTLNLQAFGLFGLDTVSSMVLTIVPQATGSAGNDGNICAGNTYPITSATAANYSSLLWNTGGDGHFDNNSILNPVYTPGTQDLLTGQVILTLNITPITSACPSVTDTLILSIHPNPVVYLGKDTTINANLSITLDATTTGASSYLWHPSGATTPTITVDSAGVGLGQHTYWVEVTSGFGCVGVDTISVTFKKPVGIEELQNVTFSIYPNPGDGHFTLELISGTATELSLRIMNIKGETVYTQQNLQVSGNITQKIDVSQFPQGSYLFEISNGIQSTIRKIVIRK